MRKDHYRLPGSRIAADRLRDIPKVALGAAWLLGPAAWVTIARSRLGGARAAEAGWARQAARVLGMRIQVVGEENIDPSERYVIAPLHEGFADAIALLHLPLGMRFVARDELHDWSVLGAALRAPRQPGGTGPNRLSAGRLPRPPGSAPRLFPDGGPHHHPDRG